MTPEDNRRWASSGDTLEEKKPFAVGLTGLLSGPDRAILWMEKYCR